MEFLNEEFYHGQKIVYQYQESKNKLWIITYDKSIGKYTLWQDNKKIATNKGVMDLYERIGK